MLHYFVLVGILCLNQYHGTNAFWWPKTTTETPSTVLQQIPLTYFRTYTYQPLGMPFFGFGAAQTPLLSNTRYDPYNTLPGYSSGPRGHGDNSKTSPDRLSKSGNSRSTTTTSTTTTPAPTTTTTTTSTTPPTTTSSSTSSSTTTTTTTPPSVSTSGERYSPYGSGGVGIGLGSGEYPTYNRRVNNMYNSRPQYPYPDYFNYQAPQSSSPLSLSLSSSPSSSSQITTTDKNGARIQFVPCMCPVSVAGSSMDSGEYSLAPHHARHMDVDDDMDMDIDVGVGVDEDSADKKIDNIFVQEATSTVRPKILIEAQLPDDEHQLPVDTNSLV